MHFFSDESKFARGFEYYASLFSAAKGKKAIGDGSVTYASPIRAEFVMPRLTQALPNCKIIHLARHPLNRLESAWKHSQYRAAENRPFVEVMKEKAFLDNNLYWKQVSAYREHYSDSNILAILFEDYIADPQTCLTRAFKFLEVDCGLTVADADEIPNSSSNFRVRRSFTGKLSEIPAVRRMRSLVPGKIQRMIKRVATRPINTQIEWSSTTKAEIVDLVREDAASYLRYCGKSTSFWPLDE